MPRRTHADFIAPLNILVTPEMKHNLIAVSYHQGRRGSFGAVARDMIQAGLNQFLAGLTPADRKRFDEVLNNVQIAGTYLKQMDTDK